MITTVADLIDALGGTPAMQALCGGVGKAMVSHMRTNDLIPERHHFRVYQECKSRRLKVDPALFEPRRKAS